MSKSNKKPVANIITVLAIAFFSFLWTEIGTRLNKIEQRQETHSVKLTRICIKLGIDPSGPLSTKTEPQEYPGAANADQLYRLHTTPEKRPK